MTWFGRSAPPIPPAPPQRLEIALAPNEEALLRAFAQSAIEVGRSYVAAIKEFHSAIIPAVAEINARLARIEGKIDTMSAELDRLTSEVAETKTVAESAVALIGGLAQQIRDLKDDPAALSALADELDASNAALSAAVTANTPAEPTPEPEPPTT